MLRKWIGKLKIHGISFRSVHSKRILWFPAPHHCLFFQREEKYIPLNCDVINKNRILKRKWEIKYLKIAKRDYYEDDIKAKIWSDDWRWSNYSRNGKARGDQELKDTELITYTVYLAGRLKKKNGFYSLSWDWLKALTLIPLYLLILEPHPLLTASHVFKTLNKFNFEAPLILSLSLSSSFIFEGVPCSFAPFPPISLLNYCHCGESSGKSTLPFVHTSF